MLRIFQSGLLHLSPNSKFTRTYFRGRQNFPHFLFFTVVENGAKLAVPDESTLFLKKKDEPSPPSSFLILMFPAERRLESLLPSGWLGVAAEASFLPLSSASPNFMWVAERMCLRLFAPFMSEKLQRRPLSSSPIIDDRSGTPGEGEITILSLFICSPCEDEMHHTPWWKNKGSIGAMLAGLQVRDAR